MKRPGVEAFLLEMGKRYETVIFTDEPAMCVITHTASMA
jgi:TFIIF-interacting CTD phosphatase-like protein